MSGNIYSDAQSKLGEALTLAEEAFAASTQPNVSLSDRLQKSLDGLQARAQAASAAFTNIITCLAIKSAMPNADVRYHQTQIQRNTDRPAGVNFRGISENVVYPWLSHNRFEGARSGWQTRTLERPKPYTLTYDENIALVKTEFLAVFDEIEECGQSAFDALSYLIYRQVVRREEVKITLSIPKTKDIGKIVELFRDTSFNLTRVQKAHRACRCLRFMPSIASWFPSFAATKALRCSHSRNIPQRTHKPAQLVTLRC